MLLIHCLRVLIFLLRGHKVSYIENSSDPSHLISEAQQFLELGEQIQSESLSLSEPERKEKLDELNELYRPWYRQALGLFSAFGRPELEELFMKEFEGSWISSKIKRFLEAGWKIYVYYKPDKPNPIIPKWTVTYERSFKGPLERQCDLLSILEKSTSGYFIRPGKRK